MFSRLEAINEMMVAVGESVITVEIEGAGDFANASAVLDAQTKKALAKGWAFNTDESVVLTPDTEGHILLPDNILSVDPVDPYLDLVQRGDRLYDRENQTDVFSGPVTIKRILGFPFEQVPYMVQQQIVAAACKVYQRSYVGSKQIDEFLVEAHLEAGADAADSESDVDDFNMLDNPDLWYLRRQGLRTRI